jgi:hypothetical protein
MVKNIKQYRKQIISSLIVCALAIAIGIGANCVMKSFLSPFQISNCMIIVCGIVLLLSAIIISLLFDEKKKKIILEELNKGNIVETVRRYKLKKPFTKEIELEEINKGTHAISNFLNVLSFFGMMSAMYVFALVSDETERANLAAIFPPAIYTITVFLAQIKVMSINDNRKAAFAACEVLYDYVSASADEVYKKSIARKFAAFYFLISTIVVSVLLCIYTTTEVSISLPIAHVLSNILVWLGASVYDKYHMI